MLDHRKANAADVITTLNPLCCEAVLKRRTDER